jgi:hypothetical protein
MNQPTFEEILERFEGRRQSGSGYTVRCRAHDDKHNSLSIRMEGGKVLLHCHAGCSVKAICAAAGLELKDLFLDDPVPKRGNAWVVEQAYPYIDENGELLYENCRLEPLPDDPKPFRQRRSVGGKWIWNLKGVRRVPYRLPELITARSTGTDDIFLAEGEKDADNIAGLGMTASSFKHWLVDFGPFIEGGHITLCRDHDESGVRQAEAAAEIASCSSSSVRILDLYDGTPLPPSHGKDVSNWIAEQRAAGLDDVSIAERLSKLASEAPLFTIRDRGQQARSGGYRFTTLDDLLAEPEISQSYVWEDTLIKGGLSIISAKPKVGKSTLARNLAVSVTLGEPFLGRSTQQGRVLYLCLEEKRSEVVKHFRRMEATGRDILVHTGAAPEDGIVSLYAAITEHKPVLTVIDPLSRVLRVTDLNDYARVSLALEPLIDLARDSGTHILALHHDGKGDRSGGDSLLGSTALFGAVDCLVQMRKRDGRRTIVSTQRYGVDLPETVIAMDAETGIVSEKGDLQTITVLEKQKEILDSVDDMERITEGEIKERVTAGSKGIISKAIRALVEGQRMFRTGQGRKNSPYLYSKNPPEAEFMGAVNSANPATLQTSNAAG